MNSWLEQWVIMRLGSSVPTMTHQQSTTSGKGEFVKIWLNLSPIISFVNPCLFSFWYLNFNEHSAQFLWKKQIKANWGYWRSFQFFCKDHLWIYSFDKFFPFSKISECCSCGIYFWTSWLFATRIQTNLCSSIPNSEFLLASNHHSILHNINSFSSYKTHFPLNTAVRESEKYWEAWCRLLYFYPHTYLPNIWFLNQNSGTTLYNNLSLLVFLLIPHWALSILELFPSHQKLLCLAQYEKPFALLVYGQGIPLVWNSCKNSFSFLLKILPSPSLHLGFHREFPTTSWQRKRRLQSGLQFGSTGSKVPPAGG